SLLVLDPGTRKVVGSFETGESPSGVAVSADGKMVVTADRDSNQVSFIDTETGAAIARVAVGERPFGVTISPDGKRVYAANVGSDDVSIIDMATHAVTSTVPVGSHPYAVAESRGKVFVTDQYGSTVTVFDAASGKRLEQLETGEYPEGIDVGSDGRFVYVANWFDNTLSKIDAGTLEVVGSVEVGDGPRAFGEFIGKAP
ncbi:MAG: YncE family protein, partial [Aurantimonas coralicida]